MDCPRRIEGLLAEWRSEWVSLPHQADRLDAAVRSSKLAAAALQESFAAYCRDLNSHVDGVTVVAILRLFDHLRTSTGLEPSTVDTGDIFELIPAVRLAARIALARGESVAAAHSTLGELYLVSGDQAAERDRDQALAHYAAAARFPLERRILQERLDLFGALGFRPTLVSAAQAALPTVSE